MFKYKKKPEGWWFNPTLGRIKLIFILDLVINCFDVKSNTLYCRNIQAC